MMGVMQINSAASCAIRDKTAIAIPVSYGIHGRRSVASAASRTNTPPGEKNARNPMIQAVAVAAIIAATGTEAVLSMIGSKQTPIVPLMTAISVI